MCEFETNIFITDMMKYRYIKFKIKIYLVQILHAYFITKYLFIPIINYFSRKSLKIEKKC